MFSEASVCSHGGRPTPPTWMETHPSGWRSPVLNLVGATAVVGTHPTGMYSYNYNKNAFQ